MPGLIDKLNTLQQRVEKLDAGNPAGGKDPRTPSKQSVLGAPHARRGEDPMTSRGFSYLKLFGVMGGIIPAERAKVETEVADIFHKSFIETGDYKQVPNSILAPLGMDLLPDSWHGKDFASEIKSMVIAGSAGADPDEMRWLGRKFYSAPSQKAQSWLDETLGGPLVAPPVQGEFIDLLRNKDALINAGASVVPLPPQGRIAYPRQTSATTGYFVGENDSTGGITGSNVGTGQLILSGKKCATLCTLPNELIRFAGPAAEALVRMDCTKTLTLTADKKLLEGTGSEVSPLGLINTPNIVAITATTVAADGNTLAAGDVYEFLSQIEENNSEITAFIMRPSMYYALLKRRVDAVTASDAAGLFLFDPLRGLAQGPGNGLVGKPVVRTAQVSKTRTKGSASNLTYILAGHWPDYLFGMFGAIEFAAATQGDTTFANDQTKIRAILTLDGGARHPGAFAVCDQLKIA